MLALLATACAPRLYVNVLQPAAVNLGAAKKLTLLESQGRESAREAVVQELKNQAQANGYFSLEDRTADGVTVKFSGRNVSVSSPPAADAVGLRIDVTEWNADKEQEQGKDKKGNAVVKEYWMGRVQLLVTAFDSTGRTFAVEKLYRATARDDADEDASILSAARGVVRQLLDDVTPVYVQKAIQLDDEEEGQKVIIDMARNGNVPGAIDAERQLLGKSPNDANAIFNLAVLLDSQGLYKDALPLYDQAAKLRPKQLYFDVRRECAQRLADAESLAR